MQDIYKDRQTDTLTASDSRNDPDVEAQDPPQNAHYQKPAAAQPIPFERPEGSARSSNGARLFDWDTQDFLRESHSKSLFTTGEIPAYYSGSKSKFGGRPEKPAAAKAANTGQNVQMSPIARQIMDSYYSARQQSNDAAAGNEHARTPEFFQEMENLSSVPNKKDRAAFDSPMFRSAAESADRPGRTPPPTSGGQDSLKRRPVNVQRTQPADRNRNSYEFLDNTARVNMEIDDSEEQSASGEQQNVIKPRFNDVRANPEAQEVRPEPAEAPKKTGGEYGDGMNLVQKIATDEGIDINSLSRLPTVKRGRVVSAICIITSIIVLILPVTILIISNAPFASFNEFWAAVLDSGVSLIVALAVSILLFGLGALIRHTGQISAYLEYLSDQ